MLAFELWNCRSISIRFWVLKGASFSVRFYSSVSFASQFVRMFSILSFNKDESDACLRFVKSGFVRILPPFLGFSSYVLGYADPRCFPWRFASRCAQSQNLCRERTSSS